MADSQSGVHPQDAKILPHVEREGVDFILSRIDIAMLAPPEVGKSTLIAAMCDSLWRLLKNCMGRAVCFSCDGNDDIYEYPNRFVSNEEEAVQPKISTNEYINSLKREWHKVTHGYGRFTASRGGCQRNIRLSFVLENESARIPFRILDYVSFPWIESNVRLSGDGLTSGDKVLIDYFKNCFALVIPVFSLAIMELCDLDTKREQGAIDDAEYDMRSSALQRAIDMQHIVPRIVEWCLSRVRLKKHGLLLFTPVKCEKYFAGHDCRSKLDLLQKRVKQLLLTAVTEHLYALETDVSAKERMETIDSIRNLIRVEYLPVQTFGTSIFVDAKLEWSDGCDIQGNPIKLFLDRYRRRHAGAVACPVGGERIVLEVLRYWSESVEDLQQTILNQNRRFPQPSFPDIRSNKISTSLKYAELVRHIVHTISTNIRNPAIVWPWDFDEAQGITSP